MPDAIRNELVRGGLLNSGMSRRGFLRMSSAGISGAMLGGGFAQLISRGQAGIAAPAAMLQERHPLRLAPESSPLGLQLVAAPGTADIGGGLLAPGWLLNGSLPSPLLRVRRGDPFDVTMVNHLDDQLILHWHGLTPPEEGDGHPRLAVHPGESYRYQFTVENRAGTYWYHSHVHHRIGLHTQMGIAGMLIVQDDEEDRLRLPSGPREVPIILQDRKLGADGLPRYTDPDLMEGFVGDEPFGNGVRRPSLDVETALYRFRILNGSNARIFRLERSDGRPLVLIGNDGGLLERPVSVSSVDLSPGERIDILMDFRSMRVGEQVTLRSAPFSVGGHIAELEKANIHDISLDLLELRVRRAVADDFVIPAALLPVVAPDPAMAVREREFRFTFTRDVWSRAMETHGINGMLFDMDRIDVVVPFGETEIWNFVNDGWFAHPVHLHATHFRVLSRTGGRGKVFPWEQGLKDTVLIHPNETVQVAVRFTAHRGLFLLHCHNLEHEDNGMMLNVLVE